MMKYLCFSCASNIHEIDFKIDSENCMVCHVFTSISWLMSDQKSEKLRKYADPATRNHSRNTYGMLTNHTIFGIFVSCSIRQINDYLMYLKGKKMLNDFFDPTIKGKQYEGWWTTKFNDLISKPLNGSEIPYEKNTQDMRPIPKITFPMYPKNKGEKGFPKQKCENSIPKQSLPQAHMHTHPYIDRHIETHIYKDLLTDADINKTSNIKWQVHSSNCVGFSCHHIGLTNHISTPIWPVQKPIQKCHTKHVMSW